MANGAISRHSRRAVLAGLAASLACGAGSAAEQIYVLSRERVLRETAVARRLGAAEARMTKQLQTLVDRTKTELAAEEVDLTRLRNELPAVEFELRVTDFDRRVRMARRLTQERATKLQKAFQEARARLVSQLPPVVNQLRRESGATMILNADLVLSVDQSFDLTDRAIVLLDRAGADISVPSLDLNAPLFTPDAVGAGSSDE